MKGQRMRTVVGVNGACGRMGRRIVQLADDDQEISIGAALEMSQHPAMGKDIGEVSGLGHLGVPVTSSLAGRHLNAVIDFSLPEGTMAILPACVEHRIPLVIATTGHSPWQKEEILAAAHHTAILLAPNMSLAVNLLSKLVRQTAVILRDRGFDVEIVERHHRYKKDSPSGTALALARGIQEIMGQTEIRHGRQGETGERPAHEIGVHAVRVGDNVGEHTVIFSAIGETLELAHRAHTRDCYAWGALAAAKFLADRPPGRYSMEDVLGL
jgi:4-hydroxy-tetrahydrodipicolinate reductase